MIMHLVPYPDHCAETMEIVPPPQAGTCMSGKAKCRCKCAIIIPVSVPKQQL